MKTLLLYYSRNQCVRRLCEESAKNDQIDVVELRERFSRGKVWHATMGVYKAVSGAGQKLEEVDINLDEYDSIIIASPVLGFSPAPVINEFLHRTNFSGREVSGLLIHPGKTSGAAGDALRKRIKLAGGVCNGIVCVPIKELKETRCNVCSLTKLKIQRAV
ncbi:MAG: hypothetical protein GXZ02_06470 [Clostridiales bacterium]|nr:hypothetical protein [Clostridiales bacterium]